MGADPLDRGRSLNSTPTFMHIQYRDQGDKVDLILRPAWSTRQQFHDDQMTGGGERDGEPLGNLDVVSSRADVGLNAGRGEKQVDDDAVGWLARR